MVTVPSTFVSYQLSKQVCLIEMMRTQKRSAPTLLAYSFFSPKAVQSQHLWALNYILCSREAPLPSPALRHLFLP